MKTSHGRARALSRCGLLHLGDVAVESYVIDDNGTVRHVVTQKAVVQALTGATTGTKGLGTYLARLPPRFAELAQRPAIEFSPETGGVAHGRDARWFVDVCSAYVEALASGELHQSQYRLAMQAGAVLRAAATIGIEQLIEEATGYVPAAGTEETLITRFLRELFNDAPREWRRFWTEDLVGELCRTFRLRRDQPFPAPLLGIIGKIYRMKLGAEAHDELKRLNPRGIDRDMHHQRFSDRFLDMMGGDKSVLRALLLVSNDKSDFWSHWEKYCTGKGQTRWGW